LRQQLREKAEKRHNKAQEQPQNGVLLLELLPADQLNSKEQEHQTECDS
jgi:hypothetical protein